jgi:hypothetical protein
VLIGRHSRVAMTPETHFFLRVVPKRFPNQAGNHEKMVERFFKSPRAVDLSFDRAEVTARFGKRPATYAELFQTLMGMYAERYGKPEAAEKTPFHLLKVPLILEWFPEARIVGIVRDGRDVVRSILKAPWTAHQSLRRHCYKWSMCATISRRLVRERPGQFMLVRYEDLVQETEATLRKVNAFLGLEFEAGQLEEGTGRNVVPEREQGWKSNATSKPDTSRIGAWAQKVTPEERLVMNTMMRAELLANGYGDLDLPPVSTLHRLVNAAKNAACRMGMYRLWHNILRYTPAERKRRHAERAKQPEAPSSEREGSGETRATPPVGTVV